MFQVSEWSIPPCEREKQEAGEELRREIEREGAEKVFGGCERDFMFHAIIYVLLDPLQHVDLRPVARPR